MRVFIAGLDGYLGWSLAIYLARRGHEVGGADCHLRRYWVAEMGSQSATPISAMTERLQAYRETFGANLRFFRGDMTNYNFVVNSLRGFRPDAIVHLAEMPSERYSMIDAQHANLTHTNNLLSTLNVLHAMRSVCPEAHLLKLGNLSDYTVHHREIPQGFFDVQYRRDPLPTQEVDWYRQTKMHDSSNIMMACRIWGLRSTDVMQGLVFGTRIEEMGDDERLLTRFDFDHCFGSAINRYCAKAASGRPIHPRRKGTRAQGYLPLQDSMQCLGLMIENPPPPGEYRVVNLFEEVYTLADVAFMVRRVGARLGLDVVVRHGGNPGPEPEVHHNSPEHRILMDLGYQPSRDMDAELEIALRDLLRYRSRIEASAHALTPHTRWDIPGREADCLDEPSWMLPAAVGGRR